VDLTAVIIVPVLFIGLPWLIFHYVTKWKQAKTLEEEISELRNADKVDAELEALKASLAKRTNGGEAAKKEG